jgi:ferredoxin-NADP reductase
MNRVVSGIGITPLLAMLCSLAESSGHSARRVWWVHAKRDSSHHPFAQETRRLLGQIEHAQSCVVYSRPLPSDKLGLTHDVEGHVTTSILDQLGAPKSADFYLCGPIDFMESMSGELKTWGAAASRIHIELFGPGQSRAPAVVEPNRKKPHARKGSRETNPRSHLPKVD